MRATQMLFRLGVISSINYIIFILTAAAVSNKYILFYYIERKKRVTLFFKFN